MSADIKYTGDEIRITDAAGNEITGSAIIAAAETVILIKEFLEDSSLTEEFKEFIMYKKLKD